ncbi:hypothetical protein SESBI_40945 [Sesbania bispinosa]|nr:hypothetical protein SESBI_40945 [Sesbania bispinosa]
MAVPQKGLSYQAADQALLVNLVKAVPVDWSQAVAVYLLLRGFNQVFESKSSFTRAAGTRGGHDDALRF